MNFLKKTATIQFDPGQTSLRKIASLLNSIGYAPEINLGDVDKTSAQRSAESGISTGRFRLRFRQHHAVQFPEYVGMEKATCNGSPIFLQFAPKHTAGYSSVVV
ncbi:MAG: hypothetical protein R2778_09360 [Saprospiraceae bacterium]